MNPFLTAIGLAISLVLGPGPAHGRVPHPGGPHVPDVHAFPLPEDPSAPTIGFVGDSLSGQLFNGLARPLARHGLRGVVAGQAACGTGLLEPVFGPSVGCPTQVASLQRKLVERYRPRVIVWADIMEILDLRTPGGTVPAGGPQWETALRSDWDMTLARLTARGSNVLVLLPHSYTDRPVDFAYNRGRPGATIKHLRDLLTAWAVRHKDRVSLGDLMIPSLCPTGLLCPRFVNGVQVRLDHIHWTEEGLQHVAGPLIKKILSVSTAQTRS